MNRFYKNEEVRAAMARKGLTIKKIEETTDLTHHNIGDARLGRPMNIEVLAKIAILLDIPWETLFQGVAPKLEEYQDELAERRKTRQHQFEEASLFTDKIAA
jgi:transcriptional regulator with XRE-family HTH domain